jgi:initiation factor 1A
MVKNTIGGKHHKKQKRTNDTPDNIRDFPWADDENTFFGKVTTLFGGNMLEVTIKDIAYKCRIPGSFRKKVWIGKGDMVLVHVDRVIDVWEVMYVYRLAEANIIKGTITFDVEKNEDGTDGVLFCDSDNIDVANI